MTGSSVPRRSEYYRGYQLAYYDERVQPWTVWSMPAKRAQEVCYFARTLYEARKWVSYHEGMA